VRKKCLVTSNQPLQTPSILRAAGPLGSPSSTRPEVKLERLDCASLLQGRRKGARRGGGGEGAREGTGRKGSWKGGRGGRCHVFLEHLDEIQAADDEDGNQGSHNSGT
jgi:hypothetical protein